MARADAERNRRAILRATEQLLAEHRPEQISMEQVAAAAGVGKGTVFHRFGSRLGLMIALMEERALAISEAIETGPPPLGPGAPPRERALAFLDAVVGTVARNKRELAALGHAMKSRQQLEEAAGREPEENHPVYDAWHGHLAAQLKAAGAADAEVLAHLLLGTLHSDPVLRLMEENEGERVRATLHQLASAVLDAGR